MASLKRYRTANVLDAARERIRYTFDNFERVYVSFSGGKDSTVMMHLIADEARLRGRAFGVLIIDLEAQYTATIAHLRATVDAYADCTEVFWVCLPLKLRNAVSQYEPVWCAWEPEKRDMWVREFPKGADVITDPAFFPFFESHMEFEEFDVLFGSWYGQGQLTAGCIGIRADESLNRFRTIASKRKEMHAGQSFTTKIADNLYNVYPVYDWRTEDIWRYHGRNPERTKNPVYDLMHLAGMSIHQMRLCQPYGDDQRRGLWLYHLLEPATWFRVVARVNGANSGALYVEETGNISGYRRITKPDGHTWESFCRLLLQSLPKPSRDQFVNRFRSFLKGWRGRGYVNGIPDEAPRVLENKQWAPSWRRMCKVILRNDWFAKGLGLTQPKSAAYGKYLDIKKARKQSATEAV